MRDPDWLALTTEEALEPELEIVDPHHHLWPEASRWGPFDVAELQRETGSGHNVVETVFIDCHAAYRTEGPEAMAPLGETAFVAGRAAEIDAAGGVPISAIIGHADLTLGGAVREVLEAHVELGGGRFRGIRHSGANIDEPAVFNFRPPPPVDLFSHADFREGASVLASMGLSFEAWVYHPQLGHVAELARAVPELPIVLNHLGGPVGVGRYAGREAEVLDEWRPTMAAVAAAPNVSLKAGGIGMARFGTGWENDERPPGSDRVVERWGDQLRWCIDEFGPDRTMFESNYPVDGETIGYGVLWNAFKKVSAGYSADERADLFAGTARRFYRL